MMKRVSYRKNTLKNVKGMTLVEIIIAMVVFAVIALILVQVGGTINTLIKRANHVNKKTSIEAPMVENARACMTVNRVEGYDDAGKTIRNYKKDTETITMQPGCLEAYTVGGTDQASNLRVSLDYEGTPINLNAAIFTAAPSIKASDKNSTDSAGDLKYIYISTWLTSGGNAIWVDNHPLSDGGSSSDGSTGDTSVDNNTEVKPAQPSAGN